MILDILSHLCLGIGSLVLLLGALGLHRFPDFFSRTHAASMTDTAGAGFILLGLILISGLNLVTIKLVLTLLFLLVTAPSAGHALAQAALVHGLRPVGRSVKIDKGEVSE